MPNADQIEVNPRAGLTFATGLRTILRSDPDVILVGEIRDEETADIAFQAAMTGHMVLSSLHAQNAASAIARLKDMDVDAGLIATALNCIVAQRLARKLCESCRESYMPERRRARRARPAGVREQQHPSLTAPPAARAARSPATRAASASSR